jgi:REP element-mobilizing transposase RayT
VLAPAFFRRHVLVAIPPSPHRKPASGSNLHSEWTLLPDLVHRIAHFSDPERLQFARASISTLEAAGDGQILAATVIPDHLHILLALGHRLSISQIVSNTKSAITRRFKEVTWQENFFEHKIRPKESAEEYARYIFMNPYQAGLLSLDAVWPGWRSAKEIRWEFESKLRPGDLPQREWLDAATKFGSQLPAGAD